MSKNGIYYLRLEMILSLELVRRMVRPSERIVFMASLPPLHFSRIGPSLVLWMRPRGGLIPLSLCFILRIYGLFTKLYVLWALSWLLVSALDRPHLFLIFSGGGGVLFFLFSSSYASLSSSPRVVAPVLYLLVIYF